MAVVLCLEIRNIKCGNFRGSEVSGEFDGKKE